MMEILVLSDSHGHPDRIREVLHRMIRRPDALLFLGDGLRDIHELDQDLLPEVYCVRGNCDFTVWAGDEEPDERMVNLSGVRVLMMHGHRYGVKSGWEAAATEAALRNADILVFGHTHEPLEICLPSGSKVGGIELSKPLYLLNPGSLGEHGDFGMITIQETTWLCSHGHLA